MWNVSQSLAQLLCEMRDVNKSLQFEVDDLKQKLKDSYGDIKVCFCNSQYFFSDEIKFMLHFLNLAFCVPCSYVIIPV